MPDITETQILDLSVIQISSWHEKSPLFSASDSMNNFLQIKKVRCIIQWKIQWDLNTKHQKSGYMVW